MTLFEKLIKNNKKKLGYIAFYSLTFLILLTITILWYNIILLLFTTYCGSMSIMYLYFFFTERWWLIKNKDLLKKV